MDGKCLLAEGLLRESSSVNHMLTTMRKGLIDAGTKPNGQPPFTSMRVTGALLTGVRIRILKRLSMPIWDLTVGPVMVKAERCTSRNAFALEHNMENRKEKQIDCRYL